VSDQPERIDDVWTKVDQYFGDAQARHDAALTAALASSVAAGLPEIQVSQNQGKFLHVLATALGATRILEIGTLGGYSTIWMARALPPGGALVTLEYEPKHAAVARANIARAGLADVVEIRVGAALDTLPQLDARRPFDLIFIDADKPNIPNYFTWALKLARVGTVIIVDNVVRKGTVIDAASDDANVQGVRRFTELVSRESRVTAATLQTVSSKGYDGFTTVVVTA